MEFLSGPKTYSEAGENLFNAFEIEKNQLTLSTHMNLNLSIHSVRSG